MQVLAGAPTYALGLHLWQLADDLILEGGRGVSWHCGGGRLMDWGVGGEDFQREGGGRFACAWGGGISACLYVACSVCGVMV